MVMMVVVGLMNLGGKPPAPAAVAGGPGYGMLGLAMVFILLTYGGWNEAAYLSGDVRNVGRDMVRILLIGTTIVTLIYVLVNVGYLFALGLEGMRKSDAIAADVMRSAFGPAGAAIVSMIVCVAALSTMNASIFTGARLYHALGQDLSLARLQVWDQVAQQSAQRDHSAKRDRNGAGLLRRDGTRRLQGDGGIYRAGILVFPLAGRPLAVRAAAARARASAPVPGAALPGHPDPVLSDLRLSDLFQPGLYRPRRAVRRSRCCWSAFRCLASCAGSGAQLRLNDELSFRT